MAENTIPQAAAETIANMLQDDPSFRESLSKDPLGALASIGVGGALATEIAKGMSEGPEVSGYLLTCSGWLTKASCQCTKFVASCESGTKAVGTRCVRGKC